ncbi:TPA: Vir protein [Legionella pneumophila]|nr:Vir protein [Legionella pneumophila]
MLSNCKDTFKAEKRIDLLFSKFAAFYGHVWRSQFKEEVFLRFAKKEWQEALGEFTDAVITKAILNCRDFYELPPTLPQMLQFCRQIRKRERFYVVDKGYVPASKAIVMDSLQKCKDYLVK